MDHIWQEMAEKMMAKDPSLFAHDSSPEDLAAAMADAWGLDRDASIWTTEDVLEFAGENHGITDMDIATARGILHDLVPNLSGINGYDVLDDLIFEATAGDMDDYYNE